MSYFTGQRVSFAGLVGQVTRITQEDVLYPHNTSLQPRNEAGKLLFYVPQNYVDVTFGTAARDTAGRDSMFHPWPYIRFTLKGQLLDYPFGDPVLLSLEGPEKFVDDNWEDFKP